MTFPGDLDELIEEGALAAPHLEAIRLLLDADVHEAEMSDSINEYFETIKDMDLIAAIYNLLPGMKIISHYNFRRLVRLKMEPKPMDWPGYTFGERI